MASGGPVFEFGKGPSTPPSCCLFPTVLPSLPILFVSWLRLFSSFDYFSEDSQSFGDVPDHIQSTGSFPGIFSGPGSSIIYAVSALT